MNQPAASLPAAQPIWTKGFVAMSLAAFLTFCNMAIFYSFASYLRTLPIDARWHGTLVGLFALVPLLLRPFVSPYFTPGNAARGMAWLAPAVALCLLAYNLADGLAGMLAVRVAHGVFYVLLMSANLAGIVGCIPPERSGQAFGYVSVIVLLPYAVVPPIMDLAGQGMAGYLRQLNMAALLMLLIPPLVLLLKNPKEHAQANTASRPGWAQIRANLADRDIFSLMALALAFYTSFAVLFFYIQGFGNHKGLANPGWFFTCSTITEILVRVVAGRLFDSLPKRPVLAGALALMLACFLLLNLAGHIIVFLGMGLLFGVAMGVAMPLINALAFGLSEPSLRAFNTNLAMQMFQGGFFLGPLLASPILARGDYGDLFLVCASLNLAGILLLFRMRRIPD